MRVALYARVSTPDQKTEIQMAELRAYAKRSGFEVFSEYSDVASGSEGRRKNSAPNFVRLMDDAHQRKFEAVIVWKMDRFARSLRMLLEALAEFKALGIEFVSLTQSLDTSTPSGRVFFGFLALVAEFERELIVERVRASKARSRAMGLPMGGPRRDFSMEARICNLRDDGTSIRKISMLTKRSRGGVAFILKRAYHKGQA